MRKKWILVMISLILAIIFCTPALANPANTFYKLGFTKPRPVYTGPGQNYYRVNGNAVYGGGGARYYGTDATTGWLLIGYRTSDGLWRMGYVTPDSQNLIRPTDSYTLFDLTFEYTPAHTTENCVITDDPLMDLHTPLAILPEGHNVTLLCIWSSGWTYVETHVQDLGTIRGFIRPSNLAAGEAPYHEPTQTPEGTWQTLYRNYLQAPNFENIYDLELIDFDFNGTPELLVNHFDGAHGYEYMLLGVANGLLYANDYFSFGAGNSFWDTERNTRSNLNLYYDRQSESYVWIKIGGDTSTGTGYGGISEITLTGNTLVENRIFEYSSPMPDNAYGSAVYSLQGGQTTDYATFLSMLDTYKNMHTPYTQYVPCYGEVSTSNAVSVFDSLADTYNNYTRYLLP